MVTHILGRNNIESSFYPQYKWVKSAVISAESIYSQTYPCSSCGRTNYSDQSEIDRKTGLVYTSNRFRNVSITFQLIIKVSSTDASHFAG